MNCAKCTRANDARRSFCGGCGSRLRLICGDCTFENTIDDCFCGGCGLQLQDAVVSPVANANVVALKKPPVDITDELADLLSSPPVELETQLPENGIVQSDVDRLFGAVS